jgi:nicotinamide-nucleotide amidase
MPTIELLCIGDELLDGRVRDLNAAWLGERLSRAGFGLSRVTFVSDLIGEMVPALRTCSERANYLLVSGGLGPTKDDRTRHAAAEWAGVELFEEVEIGDRLKQAFEARGVEFAESNRRQSKFPVGSEILHTAVGTAPGFRVAFEGGIADFVPGVPREFKWFVEQYSLPHLGATEPAEERTWKFFGLGESNLANRLDGLDESGVSVHYLARFPEIHLFIRADGPVKRGRFEALDKEVRERVGDFLVAEADETLPERLGRRLAEREWTLSTAESCTAGMISQLVTNAPGSSGYFREGWITYSNEAKVSRLGVRPETIREFGAVSLEVAAEMARGARAAAGTDVALSATGIAGPTGGSPDKPVGTVYVGLAVPDGLFVRTLRLYGRDRPGIRTLTAHHALSILLWFLEDRLSEKIVSQLQ